MSRLLDEILEMSLRELQEFVENECQERGIEFDEDILDGSGKQAYYDFIAANLYTDLEFQAVLHSECQVEPGDPMFPHTENKEELEGGFEHQLSRG